LLLFPNIPPGWAIELPNDPPVGCEESVLPNIPPDDFSVPNITLPGCDWSVLLSLLPNTGCDTGRFPPLDCVVWLGAFPPLPKAKPPDLIPLNGDEMVPNV
jgi:hypothetical protein